MEAAADAAGIQLPKQQGTRLADRLRRSLGITPEDEAAMQAEIAMARAAGSSGSMQDSGAAGSVVAGGFDWRSTTQAATGPASSATVDVQAAAADPSPLRTAEPESEVPKSVHQAAPSGTTTPGGSSGSHGQGSKRAWGSWGSNPRIISARGTLLEQARSQGPAAPCNSSSPVMAASSGAAASSGTGTSSVGGTNISSRIDTLGASATGGSGGNPADDGATVVSKRVGSSRPRAAPTDPRTRQDSVREALRVAADAWKGAAASGSVPAAPARDPDEIPPELLGGNAGGSQQWWQRRFEALYLPALAYSDGSAGFVQVDIALAPGTRDV